MSDTPHRIVVWGTGFVGKMVIREIVDHPRFDLAGVIVSDPDKDGRDAGELCGLDPIGVAASTDADAVLESATPDAVAHYGPTAAEARTNMADLSNALRRGIDVVSTAMTNFVWWPTADRWMVEPVLAACEEGGSSCFTTVPPQAMTSTSGISSRALASGGSKNP
ncbi:MAG: hypothetical protein AAGK32_02410, partial [Actinomycetota bacterium]